MQLVFSDLNPRVVDAWHSICGELENVEIRNDSLLDINLDAVVSPANSFGFMDGGIDGAYSAHFRQDVQLAVRRVIHERHAGEMVVGTACVVETGDERIPHLIAAPTMRVPMMLPSDSVNIYLATRAALLAARQNNRINRIGFPGMGTGIGRVPAAVCAAQMRQAVEDIVLERYRMPTSWAEASERHQLLYGAKPHDLQGR